MEANSVALECCGFFAVAGAMYFLRWTNKRRSIENFANPNETDGHQRAAEREEAWYKEALASFAHRKRGDKFVEATSLLKRIQSGGEDATPVDRSAARIVKEILL